MQGSVPLPDFFGHQGYHQRMNYLNKPSYFFICSHKLTRSAKPLTITMVCLIGNSLICIAVYRNARLRSSTNLYIVSLAISDIINAVIVMPFIVDVLITGKWPFGEAVCDSTPSSPCFLFTYPQPRWDWRPSTDTSASLSLNTTHESSLILDQKYISLQFGWLSRGTFQFPRWQAWLNIASSLDTPLVSLSNPP